LPEFGGDYDLDDRQDQVWQPLSNSPLSTEVERRTAPAPANVLGRLLAFFKPHLREVLGSVALGAITIASSIGLMGASAWLIVTAATHPNIAVLQIAI